MQSDPREDGGIDRYLYRPVVFDEPHRLVDPPSWLEHIPFAFWIVDALRPGCLVELGTRSGNSYAAFAQAVTALRLPTACYAIGEKASDEWREYHDRRFSAFSTLICASAPDAAREFPDESVDLLHLDGSEALSTVWKDFESWLPKISRRGVVLLHGINVRDQEGSVGHIWRELERRYPTFTFLHGRGLGVVGVGQDCPDAVMWLLNCGGGELKDLSEVRQFFSRLGQGIALRQTCARQERHLRALQSGESEPEGLSQRADPVHPSSERDPDLDIRVLQAQSNGAGARVRVSLRRWPSIARSPRASRVLTALRMAPTVLAMAGRSDRLAGALRGVWVFSINPRLLADAAVVAQGGLFDESYYLAQNPDVKNLRIHPLIHYIRWGAGEGRRPHALFDPKDYLQRYPDVARTGCEPLSHFLLHGASEARHPGPHFDSTYYLAMNPDVAEAGTNPLVHFANVGWREGRNPSPLFDCEAYLTRYADVRASGLNPLVHYVEVGRREGRNAAAAALAPLPAPPRVQLRAQALQRRQADPPVVVCLTHVCPWPPYAGNAYRINRMLLAMQRAGFRIVPIIVPLRGEAPNDRAIQDVQEQFANVVVVDRDGSTRYTLTDVPDVLASLDGKLTQAYSAVLGEHESMSSRDRELLIIDRTYCPDAAIAVVMRLHAALAPYLLFTEYVWMTRVLPILDDRAIKVLDTHDVLSTKKDKVLQYGISDFWLEPEEEAHRLALADLIVAIQSGEQQVLQALVPHHRVITAGVDFDVVGDARVPAGRRLLCVGSGNPMNVRGLRDFLKFAWPTILKHVPDAELLVAGPVGEAVEGEPAGVRVLGVLPDLTETYRSVRVVINPALAGTGFKIKTVEALSHLRPIVTWPTGVDGLPDALRDRCDVVRDWFEFASRVTARLVTDRDETFSPADRKVIEAATSPEVVYADLIANSWSLWKRRVGEAATVDGH